MNQTIPASELVLNSDGSVYHLNLHPEQIADTILLVGDPGRVPRISKYFDEVEHKVEKREFVTHTGRMHPVRVHLAAAGAPSVGDAGSIDREIGVDKLLISAYGIGLDCLLAYYPFDQNEREKELTRSFRAFASGHGVPVEALAAQASNELLGWFGDKMARGITLSAPGFYAPQGRSLRLQGKLRPTFFEASAGFRFDDLRLTNEAADIEAWLRAQVPPSMVETPAARAAPAAWGQPC